MLTNSVACITSGIFRNGDELVGEEIKGLDVTYIPITKIPILILKPGKSSLVDLCKQAQKMNLKYMAFTREAQSTTNYPEYIQRVEGKNLGSVTLIGLGVVGTEKEINSFAGSLPMLR
ncbi:MAG: DUF2000 domain-containing protein [bacterium]|nr:DUF2000 domain-containing protein [bacterium]